MKTRTIVNFAMTLAFAAVVFVAGCQDSICNPCNVCEPCNPCDPCKTANVCEQPNIFGIPCCACPENIDYKAGGEQRVRALHVGQREILNCCQPCPTVCPQPCPTICPQPCPTTSPCPATPCPSGSCGVRSGCGTGASGCPIMD